MRARNSPQGVCSGIGHDRTGTALGIRQIEAASQIRLMIGIFAIAQFDQDLENFRTSREHSAAGAFVIIHGLHEFDLRLGVIALAGRRIDVSAASDLAAVGWNKRGCLAAIPTTAAAGFVELIGFVYRGSRISFHKFTREQSFPNMPSESGNER